MGDKRRAQFDFQRYGRIALILGLLMGLYLSRGAIGCVTDAVADYDLGALTNNPSNSTQRHTDDHIRDGSKADYAARFRKGGDVASFVSGTVPYCIERASFTRPKPAYYAFLGFGGVAVLFWVLGAIIPSQWKKGVRDQSNRPPQ